MERSELLQALTNRLEGRTDPHTDTAILRAALEAVNALIAYETAAASSGQYAELIAALRRRELEEIAELDAARIFRHDAYERRSKLFRSDDPADRAAESDADRSIAAAREMFDERARALRNTRTSIGLIARLAEMEREADESARTLRAYREKLAAGEVRQ